MASMLRPCLKLLRNATPLHQRDFFSKLFSPTYSKTYCYSFFKIRCNSTLSTTYRGDIEAPHRAATFGQLDILKRLLKEVESKCDGEKIGEAVEKLRNSNGLTVLHCAAFAARNEICDYLINDLKVHIDPTTEQGSTPLHLACLAGHFLTADYLLKNGANPTATDKQGTTPLHNASKQGFEKLVQLLISKGAQVNATAHNGTPLHLAAASGETNAVKILLDNHADPNADLYGMSSPLTEAIHGRSVQCVQLLLQAGADPNKCSRRVTPLEIAVGKKKTEVIKFLLAAKANPNTRNDFDLTPLEVAAIEGHHECVPVLFPATSPISGIRDWSPAGILKYAHSDEAKTKRKKKRNEAFLQSKSKGEAAVKSGDYIDAISYYTLCSEIEPKEATILSDRSMCWARLNEGNRALCDAQACVLLRPEWAEAYYREGIAWKLLKDVKSAANSFFAGWQLDTHNKDLKSAYMENRRNERQQVVISLTDMVVILG